MAITLTDYFDATVNELAKRSDYPVLIQKILGPDPLLVKFFSHQIIATGKDFAATMADLGSDETPEECLLSIVNGVRANNKFRRAFEVSLEPGDVEKIAQKYGVTEDAPAQKFSFKL